MFTYFFIIKLFFLIFNNKIYTLISKVLLIENKEIQKKKYRLNNCNSDNK